MSDPVQFTVQDVEVWYVGSESTLEVGVSVSMSNRAEPVPVFPAVSVALVSALHSFCPFVPQSSGTCIVRDPSGHVLVVHPCS